MYSTENVKKKKRYMVIEHSDILLKYILIQNHLERRKKIYFVNIGI